MPRANPYPRNTPGFFLATPSCVSVVPPFFSLNLAPMLRPLAPGILRRGTRKPPLFSLAYTICARIPYISLRYGVPCMKSVMIVVSFRSASRWDSDTKIELTGKLQNSVTGHFPKTLVLGVPIQHGSKGWGQNIENDRRTGSIGPLRRQHAGAKLIESFQILLSALCRSVLYLHHDIQVFPTRPHAPLARLSLFAILFPASIHSLHHACDRVVG
ncbi:hypothetical protein C8R47DRAFT_91958 [Mycena vitilis]|nr:hypothetical protein C8R47DRAFT_91958 [Mycena vitilis]